VTGKNNNKINFDTSDFVHERAGKCRFVPEHAAQN